MKFLVFDTETTGLLQPRVVDLNKQPRIIELGLVVVDDGKCVAKKNWLIHPRCPLPAIITKITGIKDFDLVDMPNFEEIWPSEIAPCFDGVDCVVAHNLPFDMGMVNNEIARIPGLEFAWPKMQVCTVQEYVHLFGRRPTMKELYIHFLGKPLEQTHRAMDDATALMEIIEVSGLFAPLGEGA